MKKYCLWILLLVLLPLNVFAASIDTSFDDESCVLTVSGSNSGHDATVSLFKDGDLIGFKTGEIKSGNYSVDFVLSFDEETKINITLSNEAGGSEVRKENLSIPACNPPELPSGKVSELFSEDGTSLMINDKEHGFDEEDIFDFQVLFESDLEDILEEAEGTDSYDFLMNTIDGIFNELGEYRMFMAVMKVNVFNRDGEVIDFSDYDKGFVLNIPLPADQAAILKGLRIVEFDEENGTFEDELELTYDEENEVLVVPLNRLGSYIMYFDNDYEFLDNTGNPTFTLDKDGDLVLKIDALLESFKNLYINNQLVEVDNYTTQSGSTIITIKKEYLNSLSKGSYNVRVNFSDGKAETTLTVKTNGSILNPMTWDSIYQWIGLLFLSSVGFLFVIRKTLKITK